MNFREHCAFIQRHFRPQNPAVYQLHERQLAPAVVQAVRQRTPAALRAAAVETHPGVHVFGMLANDFSEALVEELAWIETWSEQHRLQLIRPNTMNHYGAVLDLFGFTPFLRQLMHAYVAPFAAQFFPDVALDSHHGFVVEYQPGKDVKLDFHLDASAVTLNVCLGKQFTGGELYFRGVRCGQHQETAWLPAEDVAVAHRPGQAILHRGRHRHGAHPIASGARHNLILWCRSSAFDRAAENRCARWCGWHGRPTPAHMEAH